MAIVVGIIEFFGTSLGRWIGVVLLIGLAYGAGDIRGRQVANAACEDAARAAQKAADAQDIKAAQDASSDATKVTEDLKAQKDASDAQIQMLEERLTTVTGPIASPCLYGDRDAPPSVVVPDRMQPSTGPRAGDTKHPGATRLFKPFAKAPQPQGQ